MFRLLQLDSPAKLSVMLSNRRAASGLRDDVLLLYSTLLLKERQDGRSWSQGFPILIDNTRASEEKSERQLRMGIKEAHLPCDIANPKPIHEA